MAPSARQAVEIFHLSFLAAFVAQDKERLAVKGGCNLRFFLRSLRYSEDLDLDTAIPQGTLKTKVDRLLASPSVRAPLRRHGIEIAQTSSPKQTETTQRWKAILHIETLGARQPTKIEFSRRRTLEGQTFEAIDREIARAYGMTPFLAPHYPAARAAAQKIEALALRAEPQPRDIFDLDLLLGRPECVRLTLSSKEHDLLEPAIENAMSISYDDYRAKVVAYLDPEHEPAYRERAVWDRMQTDVIDRLRALA